MICDGCGDCCRQTAMQLSLRDIRRIEKLGYNRQSFTMIDHEGFYSLINVDDVCFFFNPQNNHCKIYKKRPAGCRTYPIMYSVDHQGLLIDEETCHSAHTVTKDEMTKAYPRIKKAVREIYALARSRQ